MRKTLVVLTSSVALLVAGCSDRVLIGVVLPETGEAGVYGMSIKSGVRLAFDTAPGRRGRLAVEYRDSASDPARASAQAEALFDAGALAIIGGATTPEARAVIPIAERWHRVLLSPSASAPALSRLSTYFLRTYPSDELEGVEAADLLALTLDVRTVLIVEEDNPYTRGLLPVFLHRFASRGGEVVASVRVGDAGWQDEVREAVRKRPPAAAYLCGYGDAILEALRLLRAIGYSRVVCTTTAINTATLLHRAGTLAEGVVFPLAVLDPARPGETTREFLRRYRATYDLVPDTYAAHGYDAALALLAALERLDQPTGQHLRQRLLDLTGVPGVMGPIVFDETGTMRHSLRAVRIEGGRVRPLDAAALARDGQRGGR